MTTEPAESGRDAAALETARRHEEAADLLAGDGPDSLDDVMKAEQLIRSMTARDLAGVHPRLSQSENEPQ